MPTFGYLPYQGWVFLFIFLTLKHFPENACIFRKKSVILQSRKVEPLNKEVNMDLFDSKRQERLAAAAKAATASKEASKAFLIRAGIMTPNGELAPHLR